MRDVRTPGETLLHRAAAYGHHRASLFQIERFDSDHGVGWGNGMDGNLAGDYLPLSPPLVKPAMDRRLD
jgi:hypothetical protein